MKRHKRFLSFTMMALAAILFVACNGNASQINYSVGAFDSGEYPRTSQASATLIKSRTELDSLCAATFYNDGPLAPEYRETRYLRNLAAEYNDEYFAENALIVYMFKYGSGGWLTRLQDLTKQGDTLTLNVEHLRPISAATAVIVPWTYLLKVSKSDVQGATKVVINATEGVNVFA